MENELDLTKILKVGDKIYSTIHGESEVYKIDTSPTYYPIDAGRAYYASDGRLYPTEGECVLFPSKDQRDWSKFKRSVEFKPGQLVLVRDTEDEDWRIRFFVKENKESQYPFCTSQWLKNTSGSSWKYCKAFDIEEYLKQQAEQ